MNKIKKCSIAGVSFTMEIDAYETLSAYIESLKNNYKKSPPAYIHNAIYPGGSVLLTPRGAQMACWLIPFFCYTHTIRPWFSFF